MAHIITFGFDPRTGDPIDSRYHTAEDNPWEEDWATTHFNAFDGMQVFTERKLWMFRLPVGETEITETLLEDEDNWLELTAHNGETLALDPDLTKVFSESNSTISPVDFGQDGFVAWDEITDTLTYFNANDTRHILSINNVENTALSTWAGTNTITTLGTIGTGTWEATDVAVAHGGTGASDASGARTNLDVDQAGTDNSTDVTLVTTNHDYLSLSDQEITLDAIDLTTDISGILPIANGGTNASTAETALQNLGVFDGTLTQGFVNETSTPGRVFVSFGPGDNAGQIKVSDITTTELDYLNDVTSNIQDQLDAKEDNLPNATGTQFFRAVGSTEAWHTLVFADATDNPFEIITGGVQLNDDFLDIYRDVDAEVNGNVGTIRLSGNSNDPLSGKATYAHICARSTDIDIGSLDGEVVIGLAVDKVAVGTPKDGLVVAKGNSTFSSALIVNNDLSPQQKSLQVNGGDIDFSHTQGVRFLTENTEGGGDSDAVIGEHVFITGSQIVLDDFDSSVSDTPVETLAATLPIGSIGVYNGTGTDYTPGGDNGNLQSDVAWASMTQIRARGETASNALVGTTAAQDGDVYIYMSNPSNNNHGVFIRATVTNLDDTLTDDSITVVTIQEIIAERGNSFIETGDGNYNSKLDNSLTITGLSWAHYVNDDTDFEYAIIHASGPGTNAVDKRGRIEIAVANDTVDAGTPGQAAKPVGGNGASIILSGGDATYRGNATFSNAVILSGVADGTAGVVGIDTAGNLSRVVGGGGGSDANDTAITLATTGTGLDIVGTAPHTFTTNQAIAETFTFQLDPDLQNFANGLNPAASTYTVDNWQFTTEHPTNPAIFRLDYSPADRGDVVAVALSDGAELAEVSFEGDEIKYSAVEGYVDVLNDTTPDINPIQGGIKLNVRQGDTFAAALDVTAEKAIFEVPVQFNGYASKAALPSFQSDKKGVLAYVNANIDRMAMFDGQNWNYLLDESDLVSTSSKLQSVSGVALPWEVVGSGSGIEWSASDPYVHIDNTNTTIADGGTIGSISISDPDNEWFNISGTKVIAADTTEHGSIALSAWDGDSVDDVLVVDAEGTLEFPKLGAGYLQTDSNGVVSLVTDPIAFENTGTDLGSISTVNFIGDGVTATVNSGDSSQIDVSINAGSFGGILQDTPLSLVDNTDAGVVGEHDDAIQFFAKNATSGSSALIYSSIVGYNEDVTDGSEKGAISFKTLDGSLNEVFRIGSESSHFGTIPASPIDSFTDAEALHRFDTRGSTVNLLHQYNYYDGLNEQVEYIIRDADFTDTLGDTLVKASVSSGEPVINKEYHLPFNHKDINDNVGLNVTQALNHSVAYIQDPSTDANPQWWYEVAYRGQRRNRDQGKDGLGADVQFFQSSPVETVIRTDDINEAKFQVKAGASFFVTYTEIVNGGWLKTGANDSGTTTPGTDTTARSFLRYGYNDGKEYFRVFADSADTSTTFGATVGDETLLCAEQIWSNSNNNTHELVAFKIATGQSNND